MTKPHTQTMILSGLILALIIPLILTKCSNIKHAEQIANTAVAQNQIENLQSNIAILKSREKIYKTAQDSMIRVNSALNKLIIQKDIKASQIALNAAKEKQRVKELPGDSAAGLFLDVADCSESLILKYDSDYIVPLESIRFYNLLAVDFDELRLLHQNLIDTDNIRIKQVTNCNRLNESKDSEIGTLNEIINNKDGIIIEKDKQIVSGKRQLKAQKFKTYLVGAGGLILIGVALVL